MCLQPFAKEILYELYMEENLELLDDGINKLQCLDGEIKMTNIRNRDKDKVECTIMHCLVCTICLIQFGLRNLLCVIFLCVFGLCILV